MRDTGTPAGTADMIFVPLTCFFLSHRYMLPGFIRDCIFRVAGYCRRVCTVIVGLS